MDVIENAEEWIEKFESTWLAHFRETGERDFDTRYFPVRNRQTDGVKGIELAKSKLMFISSAGAYVKDEQTPFDDQDHEGDYSIRTFWKDIPFADLDYAHHSYDKTAVKSDPNTLLPLNHLRELVNDGKIGSLVPTVVSFMGYQPHAGRLLNETIPQIVALVKSEEVDGALLVPS